MTAEDDTKLVAEFLAEYDLRMAGGRGTSRRSRKRLLAMRPLIEAQAAQDPAKFARLLREIGPKYMESA